jgi:hypothetical protein
VSTRYNGLQIMDLECALNDKVQNWIQLNIIDIITIATYNTFFTFYEHHTFSRLGLWAMTLHIWIWCKVVKIWFTTCFVHWWSLEIISKFSFALWLFVNCDSQVVVCLDYKSRFITPFQFKNWTVIDKLQLMFVIHEALVFFFSFVGSRFYLWKFQNFNSFVVLLLWFCLKMLSLKAALNFKFKYFCNSYNPNNGTLLVIYDVASNNMS